MFLALGIFTTEGEKNNYMKYMLYTRTVLYSPVAYYKNIYGG